VSDKVVFATGAIFSAPVHGGVTAMLAFVREHGAATIGRYAPRVPIEVAIESAELFEYIETARVASELGWTATLGLAPYAWIAITWPEDRGGTHAAIRSLYERVIELGDVEFAACDRVLEPEHESETTRASLLAHFDGARYARLGPLTLGTRTLLGARLLALLDPELREALAAAGRTTDRGLALGQDDVRDDALAERFDTSAVAQRFRIDPAGIVRYSAGPAWVPLPPGPPPRAPARKAAAAIKKLQSTTARNGKVVEDLELTGLVAPFSELGAIQATDVDLEGATLAFSRLERSTLRDVGAVDADLRAVDAAGSDWLESSFDSADLRWADLTRTRFGATVFDDANLSHAVLTDSEVLEAARRTCFDHVTALRWKPDAPEFSAIMAGATFRNAVLNDAQFTGTQLEGAVFDNADLSGVTFTRAKLRGASFRGASLTGTTFTDCDLEGAVFDLDHTP